MNEPYRLAVVEFASERSVVVERGGKLYLLADLFEEDDAATLNRVFLSDLLPIMRDWDHWRGVIPQRLAAHIGEGGAGIDPGEVAFRAPIALPNKLICIGSNYRDHIAEMKIPMLPTYPYSFLKPPSTTLRGSGEAVQVPAVANMVDWEAELAVIIGHRARDVAESDALGIIAGYANFNDLSARDWLANRPGVGVDWVRHKAFDGFAPMGPYVLPAEFVADPQDLPIRLTVNGVAKQDSNTAQMVFGVAAIIEHLSSIMTLEPGDVIATGTPAGVGHGRTPQEFLKAGDVVTVEIGAMGVLETRMV